MSKKFLLFVLLSTLLCGCANLHHMLLGSEVRVHIDTAPATAELYLNGILTSEDPSMIMTWSVTDAQRAAGFLTIDVPEARWPSGAVTPQSKRTIYLKQKHHTVLIHHPDPSSVAGAFDQQSSHAVTVNYYSEPAYALLFNEHSNRGRTPNTWTTPYTFEDYKKGTLTIAPMRARWPSGATADSGALTLDLKRLSFDHTFIRPEHPGLEQDLDAVWQVEERARAVAEERAQQNLLREHQRRMEEFEYQRIKLEKERLHLERLEMKHRHVDQCNHCPHCYLDRDMNKKQRH
jgi:hypothetical protein